MSRKLSILFVILCLFAVLASACGPASSPVSLAPGSLPTSKANEQFPERSPTPTSAQSPSPVANDRLSTAQPTLAQGNLQVHFIDVGQGDSILIQAPDGKAMLIDGGDANTGVVQYLKSKGVNRLDLVVATHPHADHIGGLVQVLRAMPVAKVVTNGQPTTTKTYENFLDAIAAAKAEYVEVKRWDSLRFGDLVFSVLSPISAKGDDLNDNSVVLRLVYGKVSFLFTGDAQAQAEASLVYR